jgi:hypothetical protein
MRGHGVTQTTRAEKLRQGAGQAEREGHGRSRKSRECQNLPRALEEG